MANNETIADIRKEVEAKFRELIEAWMQRSSTFQTTLGAMQAFNNVFDRLEAAYKREIDEVAGLATKYRTALARINALAAYCHQPDTRAQIIEQCETIFAAERNGKTKETEAENGKRE